MGKFKQSVTRPTTDEEKKALIASIRAEFEKYKNPLSSTNPFSDGQELEFDSIVPVAWSNDSGKSGHYLALSFKNVESTISLTSIVKETNGYGSLDTNDTVMKPFANKDGLHTIMADKEWNKDILDDILKWFTDKNNKVKVKLTTYYLPQGTGRKTCTLTNLI